VLGPLPDIQHAPRLSSDSAYTMSTCSLMLYRRFPEKTGIISLSLLPDCDLTHQLQRDTNAVNKETGIRCWISTPQQVPSPSSAFPTITHSDTTHTHHTHTTHTTHHTH
jgi:hypothetical protein